MIALIQVRPYSEAAASLRPARTCPVCMRGFRAARRNPNQKCCTLRCAGIAHRNAAMDVSTLLSLRASITARVGISESAFKVRDEDGGLTARQFIQAIVDGQIVGNSISLVASDWLETQRLRAESIKEARHKWLAATELLKRQGLTISEIGMVLGRSRTWVREARRQIIERLQNRAFREYFEQLIDPYDQMAALGWNMRKNLKPGQSKEDAMKKIDAAEAKRARKAERNLQLAKK